MCEIDNIDCSHNLPPEEIDLSMTNGEEDQRVCEIPNRMIAGVLNEQYGIQIGKPEMPIDESLNTSSPDSTDVENRKFKEVTKKLEDEIILYVISNLVSKNVIPQTVYENAVNLLLKQ